MALSILRSNLLAKFLQPIHSARLIINIFKLISISCQSFKCEYQKIRTCMKKHQDENKNLETRVTKLAMTGQVNFRLHLRIYRGQTHIHYYWTNL